MLQDEIADATSAGSVNVRGGGSSGSSDRTKLEEEEGEGEQGPLGERLSPIINTAGSSSATTSYHQGQEQGQSHIHFQNQNNNDAMSTAQELITELFTQIQHLRGGATESEIIVREITREIKVLDLGKKNVTATMTGVKRFQMLVTAFDRLVELGREGNSNGNGNRNPKGKERAKGWKVE